MTTTILSFRHLLKRTSTRATTKCRFQHIDPHFHHYQSSCNNALLIRCFSSDGPITSKLHEMIQQGQIEPDSHQAQAAKELDRIYYDLSKQKPPPLPSESTTNSSPNASGGGGGGFFGGLFGGGSSAAPEPTPSTPISTSPPIIGAYMYGGVGCGKTFLMNLLYDSIDSTSVPEWYNDKQKVHYHQFMLNVHQHMHEQRKINPQGDLIAPVVVQILKDGRLLCLDEFQVTDVADALILQRLYEGLWQAGCVVIATSNRPPNDLYKDGLQRDRFIPFIHLMEQKCSIINLLESDTDYRRLIKEKTTNNNNDTNSLNGDSQHLQHQHQQPTSNSALLDDAGNLQQLYYTKGQHVPYREFYYQIAGDKPSNSMSIKTATGRQVKIPSACPARRLAKFSFEELCKRALGAADYLVIGKQFETVFVHDIPKLTIHHVNWLRRFITFVDAMYELNVKLVLHTHASDINEIFIVDNKDQFVQDEVFAFDRTLSRLDEMSSSQYILKNQWSGDGGDAGIDKDEENRAIEQEPQSQQELIMDIPMSTGEDYGSQLIRIPPPPLPKLRATPMNINAID